MYILSLCIDTSIYFIHFLGGEAVLFTCYVWVKKIMSVAVLCFTRLCLCINFGAIADISDLIFVLLFQVVEASALCCSHFGYNRSGCKINIFFFRFCAPFSFSSHKKCISPWYFLFSTTVTTTIPQSKTGCGSSFPRCVLEL